MFALSKEGMRAPTIARLLRAEGVIASRRGILKFLSRYETTQTTARQPGSGRRSIITEEIKEYVVNVWETRKFKIYYGDDSSQSQSSTGDLREFTGIEGHSDKFMCQGGKPDTGGFHSSYICMNVCCSTYENGCMVDGAHATAAD